jgi:hypothetical protein
MAKQKYTKEQILMLAAYWKRDYRTIERWLNAPKHPVITHPETIKIIQSIMKA